MSYDLQFGVKVDTGGAEDLIVPVAEPELSNPTYNLGQLFRACMGWDFEQGEWYPLAGALAYFKRGLEELRSHPGEYRAYEPSNGWGDISSARRVLDGFIHDAYAMADEDDLSMLPTVPIAYLWMRW